MAEQLVLTVEETARLLRIGRSAAYEAVRSGEIAAVRIGRTWRVPRKQLEALLGSENGEGPAETPSLRENQTQGDKTNERESKRPAG